MFNVELLSLAEDELSDSYDWYEEQKVGLGNRFYSEVNHYLTIIGNNPYQFPVKHVEELRIASTRKFPFLIIYWIEEDNKMVYIVSIFHTNRNPKAY